MDYIIEVDIEKLKPYFTDEEFYTLKTTIRKATTELDKIHNKIEADLNCRIQ